MFKKLPFWLFNIFSLFPLLSLNAGISKDAGTDRLMARLELCKKQPARLSSSGTRAKPKAFLPPESPESTLVHVSLYFVQSDIMNASHQYMSNVYLLSSPVPFSRIFDGTKKQKFNFAFFSMKKNGSSATGAAYRKGPALLVLNCPARWLIAWQTLVPAAPPPHYHQCSSCESLRGKCSALLSKWHLWEGGVYSHLKSWLYLQTSS